VEIFDLSDWNVLAVDDEPDSLEVLCEALELHDATVTGVVGGQAALETLKTLRPMLILTDISMPEIDGYRLLRAVRKIPELATVPVIALTAHAMKGDRELIMSAGFSGYITKPLRLDSLVQKILENVPLLKPAS